MSVDTSSAKSNTPNLCKQCSASGLPILPVRYAVAPESVAPGLPGWVSGDRVKSVDIGTDFHYVLRSMRKGFLYLYYDRNARGSRQWECYSIGEDGSLVLQPTPAAAQPQSRPVFACSRHGSNNTQVHYLVIDQPHKCGPTWIAYSEHKWSDETLKQYTDDSMLRNKRMQTIHPSAMAGGAKHSHGIQASREALEAVLEYSATASQTLPFWGGGPALSATGAVHTIRLAWSR